MNQELGRKIQKRNLEIELLNVHKYILEAIENKKRRVIVENYIKNANDFSKMMR